MKCLNGVIRASYKNLLYTLLISVGRNGLQISFLPHSSVRSIYNICLPVYSVYLFTVFSCLQCLLVFSVLVYSVYLFAVSSTGTAVLNTFTH